MFSLLSMFHVFPVAFILLYLVGSPIHTSLVLKG